MIPYKNLRLCANKVPQSLHRMREGRREDMYLQLDLMRRT